MNFIDVLPFLSIPGRALSAPSLQPHHVAVRFLVSSLSFNFVAVVFV